ncbi:MAG: DUF948 domain-containing protein [Syntrophales bacterium]|jgi:uncharacterized protein YoxC
MAVQTILIFIAIVLLIAVISIFPLVIQLYRTMRGISTTLEILNQSLPSIMINLEEITAHINDATATALQRIEDISHTVKRIQSIFRVFSAMEQIMRGGLGQILQKRLKAASALGKGVLVFFDVLRKHR